MNSFLEGVWAFLQSAFLVAVVLEVSLILEEILKAKLEFRKGFLGSKSPVSKILTRHLLQILRLDGGITKHVSTGLQSLLPLVAVGLLPGVDGVIFLPAAHSIWVFWGLLLAAPSLSLIGLWTIKHGRSWPVTLTAAERALGSSTVIFILGITLVSITGIDNFEDFKKLQGEHGWLIFRYPLTIALLFSFIVVGLFVSSQSVFSKTKRHEVGQKEGWSFNDFSPHLWRTVWTLFLVSVFLGGGAAAGAIGTVLLIFKAIVLDVFVEIFSWFFIRVREDQSETFILWNLAPLSIAILVVTILLSGIVPW